MPALDSSETEIVTPDMLTAGMREFSMVLPDLDPTARLVQRAVIRAYRAMWKEVAQS